MPNPLYDSLFGKHEKNNTPFLYLLNGEIISYKNFLSLSRKYANILFKIGLSKGDRVAIQVKKSPESLAVYSACVQSGIIFIPLNTAYTPIELTYFLEDSQAKLFIGEDSKKEELFKIAEKTGSMFETLSLEEKSTFDEKSQIMSDSFKTIDLNMDDLVAILYTSGTTGKPKGAMLSHRNLLSNVETLAESWRFSENDVLLHALPIYHTHGLFVATNVTLISGSSIIFLTEFNLDSVIKNIANATVMMGVPTFYTRLLSDPRFDRDITKQMRLFVSGSAPLLAETHLQFEERTGHRILERYGMTETNMNTSNPYDGERRAGTVGFPLPGIDLRIKDSNSGNILPDGEIGEIEVRGSNVFSGYWRMPAKTSEEFREDGFFITGDLGKIDDDGYLHISGRSKDIIISGGFNIYPKEIELILDRQIGVLESAVIGIPHLDLGEAVVGILVHNKNSKPNLEKICEALSKNLARFKNPRKLFVVDKLPRNTMGKVQKNVLREYYKHEFKEMD